MKAILNIFAGDVVSKALTAAVAVVVIRRMDPDQFSIYSLALALCTFVVQAWTATLNQVLILTHDRLGIANRGRESIEMSLLVLPGVLFVIWVFGTGLRPYFLQISLWVIMWCLIEYSKTEAQRLRLFSVWSKIEIARSALFAAGVGFFNGWSGYMSASNVLWVHAMAATVAASISFDWSKLRSDNPVFLGGLRMLAELVQLGYWRVGEYYLLVAALSQLPFAILAWVCSSGAVATFAAAFRYYSIMNIALSSLAVVMLPRIAQGNAGVIRDTFSKHGRTAILYGTIVLIVVALSGVLIPLADGGRYPDSINVFQILALSSALSFAWSPWVNVLFKFGDYVFLNYLLIFTVCLQIGLAYWLSDILGPLGAAISILFSYMLLNGTIAVRARAFLRIAIVGGEK